MADIIFPNDAPMVTGMNTCYLCLERLVEYYQGEAGCGCIHFHCESAEAVLFFDKRHLLDAIFRDDSGKSTGTAVIELLKNEIKVRNFRVSVYAIGAEALQYWKMLIHARPLDAPLLVVSYAGFLTLLEKQYERRPWTGYYRVQGDKRRQLGWILFQEKRIYGFRLPGERAEWMDPEEMPDFIARFKSSSKIHIDVWSLAGKHDGDPENTEPFISRITVEILQDLMQQSENLIENSRRKKKIPFPVLFRKQCAAWTDIYDFLDPFSADLEYHDGFLIFNGKARNGEVVEGLCRLLLALMAEQNAMSDFVPIFEDWKRQHQEYLSELQIRFP